MLFGPFAHGRNRLLDAALHFGFNVEHAGLSEAFASFTTDEELEHWFRDRILDEPNSFTPPPGSEDTNRTENVHQCL